MDSNITIHIVEPGSTPIEPVVPNTGLFTHGIGGPEATILGISAAVIILAVIVAVLYYRKKQGKFISLKHKKSTAIGLASLAAVVSLGTVAGLLRLGANAIDAEADEAEEVAEVTDGELTIELGNTPVFAWVKSTVTVTEDMPAGYTLKAYSENSTLSAEGTDKTISMVTIPEDGLENAGTLATSLTDNTWGLSIEEPESEADEIYFSLPATAEEAVAIKSIDDYSPTEAGDETTVYYGVYITPGLPYGTYTGATVSYEVEPHYITNLTFNGNGSDGGTAMEGMTLVAGNTITLPQNTYTKEGYSFTEWNTQADGEGIAYTDEAEFTAEVGVTEDVTLYAQWEALPVISDLTEMQDFAKLSTAGKASVLASMTSGQQYQLKDNRDQTMYYIAKLADGHVWMTQNLDLDLISDPTAEGYVALTPANTNITANWTPDNSTIDISNGSFPGWEDNNNVPYSADPGDVYYYTSGNDNPDTATDKATCEQAHQDGTCAHYHAGNYYNWSAAVAMNDTSEYGDDDQYFNVDTSICPAGWRLPKNRNADSLTEGNEQITEITSYDGILGEYSPYGPPGGMYSYLEGGFNAIRTAPLWLARSGNVDGGSLSYTGGSGGYWSSTVNSSSSAFRLNFGNSSVSPADYGGRYYGYSVRCIAQ